MSLIIDEIKAKAEFYQGDEICQDKIKEFLIEVSLPNGLLPLRDIIEVGYERESGFVWLKQKEKIEHKFEQISKLVSYGTEVTAYVKPGKIKKLTGVKAKEILVWLSLSDIYVDDPPTGKIHFKASSGMSRTFPVSAFEVAEPEKATGSSGDVSVGAAQEVKLG